MPFTIDIKITNPDGKIATLSQAFSFEPVLTPAPVLVAVTPTSGPQAGGTTVTLSGTGLVSGARVLFGGVPATQVVVVPGGLSLTCVTPALPTPGV